MSFDNRGKAYGAQVVSTIRSGTTRRMDERSSYKAQFQTMISTQKDAIEYSSQRADVVYFSATICGSKFYRSRWSKDFYST
jgi:hypothetical protein